MNSSLAQRLLSLSLASVFTLMLLGGVGALFLADPAASAAMAQQTVATTLRA